ncbi:scarecrow-like transcription factor 11 (SCL11 [Striga hermonthica]|uniref:Scarecrow-like transcription factor 11 (SCL11) n=1 Tax=Striga hermonthica TaxID=68872 RepID=A0A9N7RPN1_STRHE|nr:scarecrow-like transcription factor 11 (SCL11 [Striga hermonthica]
MRRVPSSVTKVPLLPTTTMKQVELSITDEVEPLQNKDMELELAIQVSPTPINLDVSTPHPTMLPPASKLKTWKRALSREEKVTNAGFNIFADQDVVVVVVVEGDPHPGACRGRMSFLSFNPSIDKLNDVASDSAATSSDRQNEATSIRENGALKYRSENVELDALIGAGNGDYKRKQGAAAVDGICPEGTASPPLAAAREGPPSLPIFLLIRQSLLLEAISVTLSHHLYRLCISSAPPKKKTEFDDA